MSRAWFLAVPLVTVLVVTYALLVAGVPRPVVGARVYGGPTEGATSSALRIEVVSRVGESESPFWPGPLRVQARVAGAPALSVPVVNATQGVAEVVLSFARPVHGPLSLELRDAAGGLLASGDVWLDAARWAGRARRRGGWIRGRADGALVVSVAPERGTFVVGSLDSLAIRVERAGSAVSGAQLTVSADGARLSGAQQLRTDARGRARLSLEASELNPTVRVEARSSAGEGGLIDTALPVVPGGFHGQLSAAGIVVESTVPRAQAYFSVVSDRGRVAGGVLTLASNGRGGSVGSARLPGLPHPAWLVVSSEVDENTAAAIGWPLDEGAEPAQTFDVAQVLLLDGLPAAFAREQARRSRVRWLSAAFIALAFALSVVLLVVRVRAADQNITQHLRAGLDPELVARVAPRRLLGLFAAVLTVALGFIALGLVALARAR